MKNIRLFLISAVAIALSSPALTGCSDNVIEKMKNADEAKMLYEFSLVDSLGKTFKSNFDGTSEEILVKAKDRELGRLKKATAVMFLSYGASVSPAPDIPQDFTQPGGVTYTVTSASGKHKTTYNVSLAESQVLPYGDGFSKGEELFFKQFNELGYPGDIYKEGCGLNNVEYGDLMAYTAFCGSNHIALFSRSYAWGYTNGSTVLPPKPDLALRLFNKETGEEDAYLNLGEQQGSYVVDVAKILAITSDDRGHMVAVVGLYPEPAELFYWVDPYTAPISLGKAPMCLDFRYANDDGSRWYLDMYANPQVRGDVTSKAVFTIGGERSNTRNQRGRHYIMNIVNGKVSSEYKTIYTKISSADISGYKQENLAPSWQMISPFTSDDDSDILVSSNSGTRQKDADNWDQETCMVRVYPAATVGSKTGLLELGTPLAEMEWNVLNTRPIIPPGGENWWSKLGMYPINAGGRTPCALALTVNGRQYSLLSTQYDWNSAFVITEKDLKASSVVITVVNPINVTRARNFGTWADWYYDEDEDECFIAVWAERAGLTSYKLSCQKIN